MAETWNLPGRGVRRIRVIKDSRYSRRAVLVGGALLVLGSIVACGPNGPGESDSLRDRLATGLRSSSPASATLVEKPETKLTPVTAEWLPGWQIIDVENSASPHPRRFYAALSSAGRAEVLAGRPDAFSAMLVSAGVRVDSAEVATSVGEVFLGSIRDFQSFSYRVDRVEDIRWRPRLATADEAERDEVLRTYRSQVKPARATQVGEGWQVTVWMVQGQDLVRHEVTIASDASVTDKPETAVTDLPVPASV